MIDEKQYIELCQICDQILMAPDSKLERVAIPWLHVIREHPVFLYRYSDIFISKGKISLIFSRLLLIIRNFIILIFEISKGLFSKGELWYGSKINSKQIDFLIISHLLNPSQAGQEEDFDFGQVPNELVAQGNSILIALMNHTDNSSEELANKWNNSIVPRIVLSKFIGLYKEINIRRRLFGESIQLRKLAKKEDPGVKQKILIHASLEAVSSSSQIALRIYEQIETLVTKINPKAIIVTYEGHAWERIAFAAARSANPDIKCIGYQKSAIFRLQHSIRRNLTDKYNPDHILTAGEVGKYQLQTSLCTYGTSISVFGSKRLYKAKPDKNRLCNNLLQNNTLQRQAVLVIPEGDFKECSLLFEFSLSCAQLCPEIQFIWRLHPLITFKSLLARNSKLNNLPENIVLSTSKIEDDVLKCSWALYRGTTAIIMAIQAGLRPIYLQVPNEMTIDPLYEIDNWKIMVSSCTDLLNVLTKQKEESQSSLINDQIILTDYCNKFFLPFNNKELLSAIPVK